MASAKIEVRLLDLPEFREFVGRVQDFIVEYAWHDRTCAAVDGDGEWRIGNPACTCGYEDALAALTQEATA